MGYKTPLSDLRKLLIPKFLIPIKEMRFLVLKRTMKKLPHCLKLTRQSQAAKRYTKKPRQTLVSSSLDSLGLSAAVAHVFHLQKTSLMDSWVRGDGVCALYCRFLIKNK